MIMYNKRLGITLLVMGIVVGIILFIIFNTLSNTARELGCFPDEDCLQLETSFSITHVAFGVVAFILALGVYLLLFYKGEEAILKRLEEQSKSQIQEDKFRIMLRMLDENEQKVLKAIKDQDGIEQSTLTLRTGLSRSKVSEIVKDFENKNLIKRQKKGKTLSIYLKERI